ncbi:MAG TPA: hypothetical protein VFL91_24955 [Thermomicrobiales bacterium]|nr:hypothetical protein [Thermomicrobiales bacterium]
MSPHDGQPIDYAGSYLFAVRPVSGADGYLWGFKQNGSVVWEDHGSEQYGIPPGTPAHAKFHMGAVEVLVRANICGAWTQVGAITISLNGPAASSSSPAPAATYSSEVFLGDPVSEAGHDLRNWGPVTTALVAGQPTYRTARLQTLDGNNAITFKRVVPGVDYVLTAIVDDGSCDDSFDIVVNGAVLEQYQAQHGYVARRHQVRVPADLVTGDQVTVVFHNRAAADACGLAGVFYVQLESAGQK